MENANAIVLAAGEGTRMRSKKHKALHEVLGEPILCHVLKAARQAGADRPVVVVGVRQEQIREKLGESVLYAVQDPAAGWGTAKAAEAAVSHIEDGPVFVLASDMPLIQAETLQKMREAVEQGAALAVMTAQAADPTGYGRILRGPNGDVIGNVEEKDATPEQRAIREIGLLVYCFDGKALKETFPQIGCQNANGEYYITDAIEILHKQGGQIVAVKAPWEDAIGINDRVQLSQAEAAMRQRVNRGHMLNGVTLIDPMHTTIGADVIIGQDTVVHPGCTLMGDTRIGEDCLLLPGCRLDNAIVGDGVRIESSVLTDCQVGDGTTVGPFAYLRPHANVGRNCRIGDFVEIKNANIGDLTRISHLTYVGDADLGEDINLGCGVVFANYDGKNKHRSTVGDRAFIGCNVNLVSPVIVGEEAYIATGSTVTEDVPSGALAIARERQSNHPGWVEKRKKDGKL